MPAVCRSSPSPAASLGTTEAGRNRRSGLGLTHKPSPRHSELEHSHGDRKRNTQERGRDRALGRCHRRYASRKSCPGRGPGGEEGSHQPAAAGESPAATILWAGL